MFDQVHTKDAPKTPSITMEGNTIYLERKDPIGFIYLRLEHGELPTKYQGAYTNLRVAEIDAKIYIEERKKAKELLHLTKMMEELAGAPKEELSKRSPGEIGSYERASRKK